MDLNYKKMILNYYSQLVEDCDLYAIFKHLANSEDNNFQTIFEAASSYFEEDYQHNKRCLLFELMDHDVDNEYRKFIYTLRNNGYDEMANKLENKPSNRYYHKTCCFKLPDPDSQHLTLPANSRLADAEPLKIKVIYSENFCDIQDSSSKVECYRTRSRNRGLVLVINNINFDDSLTHPERKGAEVDERNLKEMFHKMGLNVESYNNLKKEEMVDKIWKFAHRQDSIEYDICFVVIMSHGEVINNKTHIIGSDSKPLEEQWIINCFNNNGCQIFKNKPKILIFHICRGDLVEQMSYFNQSTESDSACSKGPELEDKSGDQRLFTDMLICHPSIEGYKALRDTIRGCWYIELFCQVFMENAHENDVEYMLKCVDKRLAKRISEKLQCQTSTYKVYAFKTCYLNPGIYEENGKICKFQQSV